MGKSLVKDAIVAELERIRRRDGGVLRPSAVVKEAAKKRSPLHTQFVWDDTKAAHEYRLQQARHLIRMHVTVLPNMNVPVRMYVSLRGDRQRDDGYRTVVDVMDDDQRRAELLADAKAEMEYFARKYAGLSELAAVFAAMRDVA